MKSHHDNFVSKKYTITHVLRTGKTNSIKYRYTTKNERDIMVRYFVHIAPPNSYLRVLEKHPITLGFIQWEYP